GVVVDFHLEDWAEKPLRVIHYRESARGKLYSFKRPSAERRISFPENVGVSHGKEERQCTADDKHRHAAKAVGCHGSTSFCDLACVLTGRSPHAITGRRGNASGLSSLPNRGMPGTTAPATGTGGSRFMNPVQVLSDAMLHIGKPAAVPHPATVQRGRHHWESE